MFFEQTTFEKPSSFVKIVCAESIHADLSGLSVGSDAAPSISQASYIVGMKS